MPQRGGWAPLRLRPISGHGPTPICLLKGCGRAPHFHRFLGLRWPYACDFGNSVAIRKPGRSAKSPMLSVNRMYPCSMA